MSKNKLNLKIKSIKKKVDADYIEVFEDRYIIVDENDKMVDDAQGYGYKSEEKAQKAMWYKFKGGKEKILNERQEQEEFFKNHKGLKNFIYEIYENNFKEISRGEVTDSDILLEIKEKFNVAMPRKYLKLE